MGFIVNNRVYLFIPLLMCLYLAGIYKFRFLHNANLFIDLTKSNNTSKFFILFSTFYVHVSRGIKIYLFTILATHNNSGPSNIVLPFHECKPPAISWTTSKNWIESNKFYITSDQPNFYIKIRSLTKSKNFQQIINYSG